MAQHIVILYVLFGKMLNIRRLPKDSVGLV